MQQILILVLLATSAFAGVVDHTRCGGVGTFRELRVETCSGSSCRLTPGTPYPIEGDLIPSSSSPSLTLKVTATYLGFPIVILEVVLANSSVQGGQLYVIKFTLTPNDLLSGNSLPITSQCSHTDSGLVEACVNTIVTIN